MNQFNRPSKCILWVIVIFMFAAGFAHAKQSNMNAYAYYKRGVSYHDKGYDFKAISEFSKAIQIFPSYAEAYYNRGNVYTFKGR